ncbi:hypothetical protein, partial [Paraburkholderia sp. C35]|uniref:hypothetical protein n=1 Tax=Paraburkholderia sp. C35 TaxID=2126993 RepID=UPI001950CCC1
MVLVLVFAGAGAGAGAVAVAGIRSLMLWWHPRFGIGSSSVAPVRGGTYFSLPPQRKVGKRKR